MVEGNAHLGMSTELCKSGIRVCRELHIKPVE